MIALAIPTIGSTKKEYFDDALSSALKTDKQVVKETLIIDNSQNDSFTKSLDEIKAKDERIKIISPHHRLTMGENWTEPRDPQIPADSLV